MDNRINDIRRKISVLRAEMLDVEAAVRDQVKRDMDCTESSLRLMGMRKEIVGLIVERDALGGRESCPNITERLRENYRPVRKTAGKRNQPPATSVP
jgi:hypothetical protein